MIALTLALALCLTAAVAATLGAPPSAGPRPASASRAETQGLAGLPLLIPKQTFGQAAAHAPVYAIRRASGSGVATTTNAIQHLRASFNNAGVTVRSGRARLTLGLAGAGRAAPRIDGDRVLYGYDGITQWFVNRPSGLEQGFTVTRSRGGERLTLALRSTGNVTPQLIRSGIVAFRGAGNLRYGGLIATDHSGRRLAARLTVADGQVRIRVDTRGARYPLRIDPTVQTAELNASGGAQGDQFGYSTAISGSTIVVGADEAGSNNQGLAYLFSTSGQQLVELAAHDGSSGDGFGGSVAISGSTVVVGASGFNGGDGAFYIFNTSGQQLAEIKAPNGSGDSLGSGVAISGSTIVVGAPGAGNSDGAVFMYSPLGVQTGVANGPSGQNDGVGQSVAISGSTIVAGAPSADNSDGAGFVYNTLGQQTAEIPAPSGSQDSLGSAVAIFGATLAIGADGYNNGQGAAFVDTTSGAQMAQLTAADGQQGDDFGVSVAISGTGVVVGADQQNNAQGDAYVFTASGQETDELTASDGVANDGLGGSTAIAGTTIVLGAYQRNNEQGSAYVYNDTLAVSETGSGSVRSSDGQINCPGTCSAGYLPGAVTTLTATPVAGFTFTGWSGAGCSGAGTCMVTVNGSQAVTATFVGTGPLSAVINSPGSGGTYALGQSVPTSFTCSQGQTGPGIASCVDSNGAAAAAPGWTGSGSLNTSTAGSHTYSVTATGSNGETSPTATISYTVVAPPINSTPPAISGTPTVGSTLTCSGDAWSDATVNVSYTWDANGTAIPGATASTYKVSSGDAGDMITCVATATNIAGSAAAASAPVTITALTSKTTSAVLALSGGSVISSRELGYTCAVHGQRLKACTVTLLAGERVVATGTAHGRAGRLRVTVKLSSYGLRLLVGHTTGVKVRVVAEGRLVSGAVRRASSTAVLAMGRQLLIPAAGMFEPNSPVLTPYGSSFLAYAAAHITHADKVVCLGYTAAPGGSLRNTPFSLLLSQQRAQVACGALRDRHVSATYATEALGKVDPLAPNTTPANLARNRRAEFQVTSGLTITRR